MTTDHIRLQVPVAVVGLGAICPGSTDAHGFWRDILAGKDLMTDVPPSHWLIDDYYDPDPSKPDKTYAKRGAFLPDVDFDPMEFGIPPSIVPATDTAQLLALIVAQKVLDDASQGQFAAMDRERMSIILGVTSGQELLSSMASRLQRPIWLKALRESGVAEPEAQAICERISRSYTPWQEATFPGLLGNVIAGRIANRFDLRGTNCVTDAACASALSAVSMGINELSLGQSDMVITGGVDTMNDIFMFMCFSKTPALSPTGDCRPFSEAADGTMLGEGLVMLALKRLADAERDGDRVYAVIRGLGSASDGRAKSVYAPLPEGQARSIRRAYEVAGYSADTVELVEAHGTGTKAGDIAEFEGLQIAFDASGREGRGWCALGSVKSQIGHTKSAAGAAGLFKAVLALHHKVLPPTIKVERPNPKLKVEQSPFYLNTRARPWVRDHSHPRRASVSSFGFGGSNFHVALEEYRGEAKSLAWRTRSAPTELVLVSAASAAEMADKCASMVSETSELSAIARGSQKTFDATLPLRLAVVASDLTDLKSKVTSAAAMIAKSPAVGFTSPSGAHYGVGAKVGELAMLFPGQGSQYVGMGQDLAIESDAARSVWDTAAALRFEGEALHEVVFPRPVFTNDDREAQTRKLTATEWAQPAIGVASAAALAALRELGLEPLCVAGHSFGEVTALYAAGALDPETFVKVARRRGELMRDAAKVPGAMMAVSATKKHIEARLKAWNLGVVLANHNAPTQVVLSGSVEAITEAEKRCTSEGLTAKRLPVATAFHSELVAPSSAPFGEFLRATALCEPSVEVFANATARAYPSGAEAIALTLSSQLGQPVSFVEMIEEMYARGVRCFVEVGPSSVLSELVGRILGERHHSAIATDRKGKHGVTSFQEALGRLAVAGVALDLAPLFRPYAEPSVVAKKKPVMTLSLNGSNYAKPYPPKGGASELPKPVEAVVATPKPNALPVTMNTNNNHPEPTWARNPPAHDPTAHKQPVQAHSSDVQLAWVHAYQEAQKSTAEAHAAYQRAMAESHQSFLRMAEGSFAGLTAMMTGQPLAVQQVTMQAPAAVLTRVEQSVATAPITLKQPPPQALSVNHAPEARVVEPAPSAPAVKAPAAAPKASAVAPKAIDIEALMLTVVAEKTGYPSEMLAPHMELEADLGIDSIKRVEILAAIRERSPGMPEVKPNELAQLRTLGQIVDRLRAALGASAPKPLLQSAATMEEAASVKSVQRFALRAVQCPSPGMCPEGLTQLNTLVVTDEGSGLAQALCENLSARGLSAKVVTSVPPEADGVIFLGAMQAGVSVDEAVKVEREAFFAARALAPRLKSVGGLFVTVQDTGGDFGLSGVEAPRAYLAGVAALARTAALEWPSALVRAIDLERAGRSIDALASALTTELFAGGAALEIGLRADGSRVTLASVPTAPLGSLRPIESDGVIVVSGGARGVTASSIGLLAKLRRPRIALLGRTVITDEPEELRGLEGESAIKRALLVAAGREGRAISPSELGARAAAIGAAREVRGTIKELKEAGSEVEYFAVDVQDRGALGLALDQVRKTFGAITGLVHGAGVLADKLIGDKTDEQFDRVFAVKVGGARALLDATANDPLTMLCFFSSVAARAGNIGQCDYAMANEVLNALACAEQRRREGGCVVRSIGWGPWEGGMVTPSLKAHFQSRGVALIPLEAGAGVFVEECEGAAGDTVILVGAGAPESALGAGALRAVSLVLKVDAESYPFLSDHRVESAPVVPVALALEWMSRVASQAFAPGARFELSGIRVMRGIRLDGFHLGGDRVFVRAKPVGPGLAIELRGANNALHYSGTARALLGTKSASDGAAALKAEGVGQRANYDGHVLFHGPDFQVIREVQGLSERGVAGSLSGLLARRWKGDGWATDPAVIDGGLQLGLVWANKVLGGPTLPMAVEGLRVWSTGAFGAEVRCVLRARSVHPSRAVCDLTFMLDEATIVAEMTGVELILRPETLSRASADAE